MLNGNDGKYWCISSYRGCDVYSHAEPDVRWESLFEVPNDKWCNNCSCDGQHKWWCDDQSEGCDYDYEESSLEESICPSDTSVSIECVQGKYFQILLDKGLKGYL